MLIAVTIIILAGVTLFAYGHFIEMRRLCVKRHRLAGRAPLRVAQLSDIHYRGRRKWLESVVREVNSLAPDLICITGDLSGARRLLPQALEILRQLSAPVFAVPGNWDHRAEADFETLRALCEATGGRFLLNDSAEFGDELTVVGLDDMRRGAPDAERAFAGVGGRTLVLMHCPATVAMLGDRRAELILAGHTHGGQVRLPLLRALIVPRHSRPYVMGMFETPNGPLYVNPGLGASGLPSRLLCPPEITLFDFLPPQTAEGLPKESNGRPA